MNAKKLKGSVGHRVRLRPVARRFDGNRELPEEDDDWILSHVDDEKVELRNPRTGHVAVLGGDHIHSYTTDPGREWDGLRHGFLLLHVQVSLYADRIEINPIPPYERRGLTRR